MGNVKRTVSKDAINVKTVTSQIATTVWKDMPEKKVGVVWSAWVHAAAIVIRKMSLIALDVQKVSSWKIMSVKDVLKDVHLV